MRECFTVNWTLFPNFDKNIEFAIECIASGRRFLWWLLYVQKKGDKIVQ